MEGRIQIVPNSCSSVCCANGVWDSTEGMLFVTNRGVDVITLSAGDVVAAAWVAPSIEGSGDEFNHIIQDDALIERIFEVELPPDEYYELLAVDMSVGTRMPIRWSWTIFGASSLWRTWLSPRDSASGPPRR